MGTEGSLSPVLTKVQIESSIQSKDPPMLNDSRHRLESPFILVAGRNRLTLILRRLALASKQD